MQPRKFRSPIVTQCLECWSLINRTMVTSQQYKCPFDVHEHVRLYCDECDTITDQEFVKTWNPTHKDKYQEKRHHKVPLSHIIEDDWTF